MKRRERRGYLLMEALIALSLLAGGVATVSSAFSQTRGVLERGGIQSALAVCAQEKILAETAGIRMGGASNGACADGLHSAMFTWTRQDEPFSPHLRRVVWTASWTENGTLHEEPFEILR